MLLCAKLCTLIKASLVTPIANTLLKHGTAFTDWPNDTFGTSWMSPGNVIVPDSKVQTLMQHYALSRQKSMHFRCFTFGFAGHAFALLAEVWLHHDVGPWS